MCAHVHALSVFFVVLIFFSVLVLLFSFVVLPLYMVMCGLGERKHMKMGGFGDGDDGRS